MKQLDGLKLLRGVADVRGVAGRTAFVWLAVNGVTMAQWHSALERFGRLDRHCKIIQENWIPTWQIGIRPLVGAPTLLPCAKEDEAPPFVVAPGKTRVAGR